MGGSTEQKAQILDKPASLTFSDKLEASELRTVKCYRCYSNKVSAICHHCGRFLCDECLHKTSGRFLVDNVFAYLKPSLGKKLEHGAHCADCFHRSFRIRSILVPVILSLLLMLILSFGLYHDWFLRIVLMGTVIVVGLGSWLLDRLQLDNVTYPIGFPLFSRLEVEIQERILANFNIDDHPYLSPDLAATGFILITLNVNPNDWARFVNLPFPKESLKFHAGFIVLETLKNIEFVKRSGLRRRKNLLLLTNTIDHDTFESYCRQSGNLHLVEPYRIHADALRIGPPHDKEFPLIIKARRANGGYRLEIIIELLDDLKLKFGKSKIEKKPQNEKGLAGKPILDLLVLHLPIGCEVEFTNGHFDKQARIVRWYKSALNVKPVFSVFVQFQQVMPDDKQFRGEYSVTIDNWTISQLHVAQDATAGAHNKHLARLTHGLRLATRNKKLKWLTPLIEHKTKIEGELWIDTSYLLSQQVQTASDVLEAENTQTVMTDEEKLLVAPTHHVINAIVDNLTKENVFIKQITEIPGQVVETKAGSQRARYWKILGKYYATGSALQPIDLQLVISGSGFRNNGPNCNGSLSLELSLRHYVEMSELEASKQLQELYRRFKGLIKIAAYQGRQIEYQGKRTLAWSREERIECKLQDDHCIDRIATILTSSKNFPKGHVFVVSNGKDNPIPNLPDYFQIHLLREFPLVQIPGRDWVDKWKLLREIEIEH